MGLAAHPRLWSESTPDGGAWGAFHFKAGQGSGGVGCPRARTGPVHTTVLFGSSSVGDIVALLLSLVFCFGVAGLGARITTPGLLV
jgi:hypothetical protein